MSRQLLISAYSTLHCARRHDIFACHEFNS